MESSSFVGDDVDYCFFHRSVERRGEFTNSLPENIVGAFLQRWWHLNTKSRLHLAQKQLDFSGGYSEIIG
jgi:hypothetical protein